MAVTVYRWLDGSAPTLSGTVGSLNTLLDTVLVDGYGSKSAAGWTQTNTGTNGSTFTNAGTYPAIIQVDDNSPGTGGAREARLWGWHTTTGYGTGTGQYGGYWMRKSNTADSLTRPWVIFADAETCHLFIRTGDNYQTDQQTGWSFYSFGAYYAYHTISGAAYQPEPNYVMGNNLQNSGATSNTQAWQTSPSFADGSLSGHQLERSFVFGTLGYGFKVYSQASSFGNAISGGDPKVLYPDEIVGDVSADHWYVADNDGVPPTYIRGHIRGIYQSPSMLEEAGNFGRMEGATGTDYDGKEWYVVRCSVGASSGSILMETTWLGNP